jgi:ABC-type polysaccharide transport system, permease component
MKPHGAERAQSTVKKRPEPLEGAEGGWRRGFAPGARSRAPGGLLAEMWRSRQVYFLILPGLAWYIIFAYVPMGGLSLAFKAYKANLGIWASPWVGMTNFDYLFRDPAFIAAVWKSIYISLGRIVFEFPVPIVLAIAISELRVGRYKKALQTVFTLPQFLSWVIVASIFTNFFSLDGFLNGILKATGQKPVSILGSKELFIPLVYFTDAWKSSGWSAIIYLAVIAGIDTEQYEAAEIDGASRTQRIGHITLPSMAPTIAVLFILMVGNIMRAGFDQIFNLSNPVVAKTAEILDMYVYRITFQSPPDFGFSSAVSLFTSVVNMTLLLVANKVSKKLNGNGLFM